MISPRHLLFTVITLGLIAALAYLYYKTEAVDLGKRNEITSLLRNLQEIDGRLDTDVLKMRSEMDPLMMPVSNRTIAVKNALRALENALPLVNSPALNGTIDPIAKAISEKADLVEKFKVINDKAKDALRNLTFYGADPASLEEKTISGTGEPRNRISRNKVPNKGLTSKRKKEFAEALNQVSAAATGYYWLEQKAQRDALETAAARLVALSGNMDDLARQKIAALNDAAQTLLSSIPAQRELSSRISLLTSGTRLYGQELLFNRELEATLDEKERFRVYMIAYAIALLIGIGYLGIRIIAANEMLEHRVAERTRELSDTLQHLKESEAQLIQSEKMSSLGQMVAGVAHEINTPLAYVNNSLNAVNDRLPEITSAVKNTEQLLTLLNDPNVQPDVLNQQFSLVAGQLAQIKQHELLPELGGLVKDGIYGTGQVAEIVSNLKDFSRLDRSKESIFNLNDGLNSTLGLARHLLKSIKVNKRFGEIPDISCAPSQINQVFLNLITNAAQALPPQNGEITLVTRSERGGVTVEITDNGSGIPPDVLPKIFDPFFTTKDIGKGTGLGLSISYQIVKDHGGSIHAESKVGHGTKFTVWLPIKPPADNRLSA